MKWTSTLTTTDATAAGVLVKPPISLRRSVLEPRTRSLKTRGRTRWATASNSQLGCPYLDPFCQLLSLLQGRVLRDVVEEI